MKFTTDYLRSTPLDKCLDAWADGLTETRQAHARRINAALLDGRTMPKPDDAMAKSVTVRGGKVTIAAKLERRAKSIVRSWKAARAETPTHDMKHVPGAKANAASVAERDYQDRLGALQVLLTVDAPTAAAILAKSGIVPPVPTVAADPRIAELAALLGITAKEAAAMLPTTVPTAAPTVPTVPTVAPTAKPRSPKQLANDQRLRDAAIARAAAKRATPRDVHAPAPDVVGDALKSAMSKPRKFKSETVATVATFGDLADAIAVLGTAAVDLAAASGPCPSCGEDAAALRTHRQATRLQGGDVFACCETCLGHPGENVIRAAASRVR